MIVWGEWQTLVVKLPLPKERAGTEQFSLPRVLTWFREYLLTEPPPTTSDLVFRIDVRYIGKGHSGFTVTAFGQGEVRIKPAQALPIARSDDELARRFAGMYHQSNARVLGLFISDGIRKVTLRRVRVDTQGAPVKRPPITDEELEPLYTAARDLFPKRLRRGSKRVVYQAGEAKRVLRVERRHYRKLGRILVIVYRRYDDKGRGIAARQVWPIPKRRRVQE